MSHTLDDHLHAVGAHILTCGFSESRWSDTTLLVNSAAGWQAQFNLHALILSRSPFFARCIPDSRHLIIEIFVHDPVINQDAIHICPAHIYGAAPPQQQPLPASTARALLAAASLLELDDLAEWALAQARSSLVLDAELIPTTHFLSTSVAAAAASTSRSGAAAAAGGNDSPSQQPQLDGAYMLVHDRWAAMLQQQQQNGNNAGSVTTSSSSSAPPPGLLEPHSNNNNPVLYPRHQHESFQDPNANANGNGNGNGHHLIPQSDISSASSPNTFDPTTPSLPQQQQQEAGGPWATTDPQHHHHHQSSHHYPLPYPSSYHSRIFALQEALFLYLASTLPTELGAFARQTGVPEPSTGADRLADVYTQLDFELFREVMQSTHFPVSSVQERFAFAKRCIAIRNKTHAAQARQQQTTESYANAAEEQVVLAFGGSLSGPAGRTGSGLSFGGSGASGAGTGMGTAVSGGGTGSGNTASAGTVQIFRKPVRRRFNKASAALT
ncbi:unnamed protein product [Tilletia controversa]|nr:unnamed protein product [Tilletia controversa]